jgi:hypothetical protein
LVPTGAESAGQQLVAVPPSGFRSLVGRSIEQFVNALQGGYKRPGTLNKLLALSQHPKEMLHSFMQHFCQLTHGVVNTSDIKIIAMFIARVHDNRCREELRIREPSLVSELYALIDECV